MPLRNHLRPLLSTAIVLGAFLACQSVRAQAPPPPPPTPAAPATVEPVIPPDHDQSPPRTSISAPPVTPPADPCISTAWLATQNANIRQIIVLQAGEAAALTEDKSEAGLKQDEILRKRLNYLKALIKLSRSPQ